MLRSYRSIVSAIVGIALIAVGIGYGLAEQASYADRAYNHAADYAEDAADQIAKSCLTLATSEQPKCFREGADKYRLDGRDKQREYEDLIAQRKSALWAMIMGIAALIGMALSVVGVVLVWLTFQEQKAANTLARSDAETSANESAKALAIASDNAQAARMASEASIEANRIAMISRRPWLDFEISVKSFSYNNDAFQIRYEIIVSNIGATPSVNVGLRTLPEYETVATSRKPKHVFGTKPPPNQNTCILPGGQHIFPKAVEYKRAEWITFDPSSQEECIHPLLSIVVFYQWDGETQARKTGHFFKFSTDLQIDGKCPIPVALVESQNLKKVVAERVSPNVAT